MSVCLFYYLFHDFLLQEAMLA